MSTRTVQGFEIRVDRLYDLTHHIWVETVGGARVRVGMDALGLETSGTVAHLSMTDPGASVRAGEPFGSLEAEKYVGPLVAPLSGRIVAANSRLLENAGLVQVSPYDEGWMIELEAEDLEGERGRLVEGEEAVVAAFEKKIAEYRLEGVLAE